LHVGASAQEVLGALGAPGEIDRRDQDGNTEVWYYEDGRVVVFDNGKASFSHPISLIPR
jgi:hypothetical protein